MKHLFLFIYLVATVSVFAQKNITGSWENEALGTMILDSTGRGSFAGAVFTYTYTTDKIVASSIDGEMLIYNYSIADEQLIISGGNFAYPFTFVRLKKTEENTNSILPKKN